MTRALITAVLVVAWSAVASAEEASSAGDEPPIVSLYTMGAGDSLFERWGHAAMCLQYPRTPSRDLCFNYGTTNFSTPAPLTWQFLRGRADFWVDRSPPGEMLRIYRALNRTVWRQDLPLTDEQARAIERRLFFESRPENAHFRYDHFRENCSTRLRDIIDDETGGRLRQGSESTDGRTFRDVGRAGAAEATWLLLLTDLILGRSADEQMTAWQAMFLPRMLREEVFHRVDAAPILVLERQGRRIGKDPGHGGRGWVLLFAVLLAAAVVVARRRSTRRRTAQLIAGIPLGTLALLPWGLALVSTVNDLRINEVLLVLCPLDAVAPALADRWTRTWFRARLVGLGLVAVGSLVGVLRQPLVATIVLAALPILAVLAPIPRRCAKDAREDDDAPRDRSETS